MTDGSRFTKSLSELEAGVRVPVEDQVESQPADPPADAMAPEDLDRLRLLADPAGGRLRPGGG